MANRGATGAASEMVVGADLLMAGYEVYRAMSPSSPCDLLIMKDGVTRRVEVRTGRRNPTTGSVFCPTSQKDVGRYDVLAIYIPEERHIEYRGL